MYSGGGGSLVRVPLRDAAVLWLSREDLVLVVSVVLRALAGGRDGRDGRGGRDGGWLMSCVETFGGGGRDGFGDWRLIPARSVERCVPSSRSVLCEPRREDDISSLSWCATGAGRCGLMCMGGGGRAGR